MCRKKNKYLSIIIKLLLLSQLLILSYNFKFVIVDGFSMQPTYNHHQILIARRTDSIEKDEFFVVGDNYQNSFDRRDYGVINSEEIYGIASLSFKLTIAGQPQFYKSIIFFFLLCFFSCFSVLSQPT